MGGRATRASLLKHRRKLGILIITLFRIGIHIHINIRNRLLVFIFHIRTSNNNTNTNNTNTNTNAVQRDPFRLETCGWVKRHAAS